MEKNVSYRFVDKQNAFTNGAFITPMEITKEDGTIVWMWVVNSFEDDTFQDGVGINPKSTAEDISTLINGDEDEG